MELVGKVVSAKMTKTVVVLVERLVAHPIYKKRIRKSTKFKVHDDIGVKMGDVVKIASTRPISKDKHFKIQEVVTHGVSVLTGKPKKDIKKIEESEVKEPKEKNS